MNSDFKSLSFDAIETSREIQSWLNQFDSSNMLIARSLLHRLQFVSIDTYSAWLLDRIKSITIERPFAVYSVRKFEKNILSYWQPNGDVQPRPARTQGSEDLVYSIISRAHKQNKGSILDHPTLNELKMNRVRNIILIDDSIGSGERVSGFIRLMTNHRTFMSWWSYGFITLNVLSLARTRQSEKLILQKLAGSDHGIRKHRISDKLQFDSDIVYDARDLHYRWGDSYQAILDLCNNTTEITVDRRRGYGNVMGNIVFYHSVPNNIPGMLYSTRNEWQPLFPGRALPDWCEKLLERAHNNLHSDTTARLYQCGISDDVFEFLLNIRRGIRTEVSLARRMNCDIGIAVQILDKCKQAGLVSEKLRLTDKGYYEVRRKEKNHQRVREQDRSLYIPTSWVYRSNDHSAVCSL